MDTEKIIKYKSSDVVISKINGNWERHSIHCCCCNNPIKNGKAVIFINNYKYIPNVLIHNECFDLWELKVEELLNDIEKSYQQYQILNKVFG